jgi:hypothetical protein
MKIKIRYLMLAFACLITAGFFTSNFSALMAGSKQDSLEERIQRLEAIEEIQQLHMHYVNIYSGFEKGEIGSLFAKDGICAAFPGEPIKGREAIAKLYARVTHADGSKGGVDHSKNGVFAVHPMITVEGGKAKATWMFLNLVSHEATNQMLFFVQGVYDAEYVKEDGKWLFSFLKWTARIVPKDLQPGGAPQQ